MHFFHYNMVKSLWGSKKRIWSFKKYYSHRILIWMLGQQRVAKFDRIRINMFYLEEVCHWKAALRLKVHFKYRLFFSLCGSWYSYFSRIPPAYHQAFLHGNYVLLKISASPQLNTFFPKTYLGHVVSLHQ